MGGSPGLSEGTGAEQEPVPWKRWFSNYPNYGEDVVQIPAASEGQVVAFMNAAQTHRTAVYLIGEARETVFLMAFTYDLESLTEALLQAASRGASVTVAAD